MRLRIAALLVAAGTGAAFTPQTLRPADRTWTTAFVLDPGELVTTGRNPYFILEPGYVLTLEDGKTRLVITVLDETRPIDNVETRVVEERETVNGELVEVSRNFFALSTRTNAVFYFGEDVDMYRNGKVMSHEGAWRAGEKGARFGLAIPGLPLLGSKYYQEIAPGVALDRAEVVGLDETVKTPAGVFSGVLKVAETTPLEPAAREFKYYARGVGLVMDGTLRLVKHGSKQPAPSREPRAPRRGKSGELSAGSATDGDRAATPTPRA